MLSRCLPSSKQLVSCFCPAKEFKKEVKALVEKGFDKVDQVKDAADKAGNKTGYLERRLMIGSQGYKISEAMRQIHNCFEAWDPEISEHYFHGVLISEFMKYCNGKGGRIEPDPVIWR